MKSLIKCVLFYCSVLISLDCNAKNEELDELAEFGEFEVSSVKRNSLHVKLPLIGDVGGHSFVVTYSVSSDVTDEIASYAILKLIKLDLAENNISCFFNNEDLEVTRLDAKEYSTFEGKLSCKVSAE